MIVEASTPEAMQALGGRLAAGCKAPMLIFLRGNLGAGKTTLVRGFLRALGHTGVVNSPTFTLVEPYTCSGRHVYHIDLYRISDVQELELIGYRDYLQGDGVCLVEWPEHAQGALPSPDVTLSIEFANAGRTIDIQATSAAGKALVKETF